MDFALSFRETLMLIAPKINENIESFTPEVRAMCGDRVLEIQLLGQDPAQWEANCRRFLETGLIGHLVVHLPIPLCQIAHIYLSSAHRRDFEALCRCCNRLSREYGVRLSVLFHCDEDYRYLSFSGCVEWLKGLVAECNRTFFLAENIFPDSNSFVGERRYLSAPFFDLLEAVNDRRFGFCFDLCHYEVGNTIFRGQYALPERLFAQYTRYVHFSRAADDDGYITHATHSCPHADYDSCRAALRRLDSLGIPLADTVLTLELSETDYRARPNLAAEYRLVSAARERGDIPGSAATAGRMPAGGVRC